MIDWAKIDYRNSVYYFSLQNKNKNVIPPLEAAQNAVKYIVEKYPAPYTLYASGGVDSQAMIWAWKMSGYPFKVFSALYNNEFNLHDIQTLKDFANRENIDIDYYNFDLLKFLETEYPSLAEKYWCGSPHIVTHMKLASLTTSGTVILSGNFIDYTKTHLTANLAALYHYAKIEKKSIVPWFFLETEDLAFSFLHSEKYKKFLTADGRNDGYLLKCYLYQENGFPVIPQQKKLTGFEVLKDYIDDNPPRKPTHEDLIVRNQSQSSKRLFDILYRNKYEQKYSKHFIIQKTVC